MMNLVLFCQINKKIKSNQIQKKWIQNINEEGKEKLDEALKCICEGESLK